MDGEDTARRSERGAQARPQAVAPVTTGDLTPGSAKIGKATFEGAQNVGLYENYYTAFQIAFLQFI